MLSHKLLVPSLLLFYLLILLTTPSFIKCAKQISSRTGDEGRRRGILPSVGKNTVFHNLLLKNYCGGSNARNHQEISSASASTTTSLLGDEQEDQIIAPMLVLEEGEERLPRSFQSSSTATASTGTTATATTSGNGSYNRMPSIFLKPEENYLDKYAACLAATEGLRKLRDSTLAKSSSSSAPIHRAIRKLLPKSGNFKKQLDLQSEQYRQACSEYALNSSKVIRALGLSVAQFNQIGRQVSSDPVLKEKVMEQAYLYRITATLNMDKVPLIEDPTRRDELFRGTNKNKRMQMFAKSMHDIEELRQEQTEKLLKALSIDRLPESVNICDPKVLPFLSPQIRAVVEAFPLQAEDIVKKYGLSSDEFNQMLQEVNTNKSFRMKVDEQIKRSNEESRLQKVFNN